MKHPNNTYTGLISKVLGLHNAVCKITNPLMFSPKLYGMHIVMQYNCVKNCKTCVRIHVCTFSLQCRQYLLGD